jgi:putative membrane protein
LEATVKFKWNNPAIIVVCLAVLSALPLSKARATVTDEDKKFLAMAAQSDFDEIKLSQLAETKATNPLVESFAHEMITDHTNLVAKMKPFATAWGITPPTSLDPDHQAIYDKLNSLSGSDFDKAYMDAVTADHHKALDAFTKEADTTTDLDFKTAVTSGKSVVAAHTRMADDLKTKLNQSAAK